MSDNLSFFSLFFKGCKRIATGKSIGHSHFFTKKGKTKPLLLAFKPSF